MNPEDMSYLERHEFQLLAEAVCRRYLSTEFAMLATYLKGVPSHQEMDNRLLALLTYNWNWLNQKPGRERMQWILTDALDLNLVTRLQCSYTGLIMQTSAAWCTSKLEDFKQALREVHHLDPDDAALDALFDEHPWLWLAPIMTQMWYNEQNLANGKQVAPLRATATE
jgi:hypothetical protein